MYHETGTTQTNFLPYIPSLVTKHILFLVTLLSHGLTKLIFDLVSEFYICFLFDGSL